VLVMIVIVRLVVTMTVRMVVIVGMAVRVVVSGLMVMESLAFVRVERRSGGSFAIEQVLGPLGGADPE
jgi:hypothetical protein